MDSNDQRAPWGLPEAQPSTLLESKGCVPGGMRWLLPPSATRSALLGGDRGLWCGTSSSLQTESTVQHNGEKRITILQSPLTNHFPTFAVWESSLVLFPSAGLKPTNSSTVSGAKLHRQLQSLLIQGSSTSSNSAFIYKWFDQIPPPILTGFHNTRHTLILAMLIAPFVYDLKSRRFHLSYHIDSWSLHPWTRTLRVQGRSAVAGGVPGSIQHKGATVTGQEWSPWQADTRRIFVPRSSIILHVCTRWLPHHSQMKQSRWILYQNLSLYLM